MVDLQKEDDKKTDKQNEDDIFTLIIQVERKGRIEFFSETHLHIRLRGESGARIFSSQ